MMTLDGGLLVGVTGDGGGGDGGGDGGHVN